MHRPPHSRRRFLAIFLVLAAVMLSARDVAADETITIGSILILSGEGASWGNASKNGIDMAIQEINANGGVLGKKLAANHQDDQGDVKKTLSAFRHLVDAQGVRFVIGPNWARNGIPLISMADQKKVVMISPSLGLAKFNESSDYLFNTWPHDFITSRELAKYVYGKGHRNVAVIGAEEPWVKEQTNSFVKQFKALGGTVGFLVEPNPDSSEFRTEALKIAKNKNLDALVSTTNGVIIGSLVAKVLMEMNSALPTYSVTVDQAAIDAAGGGFEGMRFVTFLTPQDKFKEKYESEFNTTIDIGADSAYDAVKMLADAMHKASSSDPELVARQLNSITSYSGVSGELAGDGKGGFTKDFVIMEVKSGKPVRTTP